MKKSLEALSQKIPYKSTDLKLVHKHKLENVLISNIRRALPPVLRGDMKKIISEHPLFSRIYKMDSEGRWIIDLSLFDIHSDLTHSSLLKEIADLLSDALESDSYLNFRDDLDIAQHAKALSVVEKLGLFHNEIEWVELSQALEEYGGIRPEPVFYAHLLVNPKHSFFFEHHNDHIPGMKLIEAIRQMGTACWHLYGKVPLKNSHFILSGMQINFFNYVNIHHPIRLAGVFDDLVMDKNGVWLSYSFHCKVYQNGELCMTSVMPGKMIHSRLYKRLRKGSLKTSPTQRFHPMVSGHIKLELRSRENGKVFYPDITDLSYQGFRADLGFHEIEHIPDTDWEFTISADDKWISSGHCRQLWKQKEGSSTGFRITLFEDGSDKELEQIITRFCVLIPVRSEGIRYKDSEG